MSLLSFPVYFHLGPLRLHPHMVMETIAYASVGALVGALVGAKLLVMAQHLNLLGQHWRQFVLMALQGKTIVGALLGGLIGVELTKKMIGVNRSFVNQVLPWVCFNRGTYYGSVDAYGTSQECPDCGARVSKGIEIRVSHCTECGSIKPRDMAAAQVIKAYGLSGIQTVCGRELSGTEFAQSRQDRVKQKCLGVSQGSPRYSLSA